MVSCCERIRRKSNKALFMMNSTVWIHDLDSYQNEETAYKGTENIVLQDMI